MSPIKTHHHRAGDSAQIPLLAREDRSALPHGAERGPSTTVRAPSNVENDSLAILGWNREANNKTKPSPSASPCKRARVCSFISFIFVRSFLPPTHIPFPPKCASRSGPPPRVAVYRPLPLCGSSLRSFLTNRGWRGQLSVGFNFCLIYSP